MEKEKNLKKVLIQYSKENLLMEKEMEKEKNIIMVEIII